MEHVESFAGTGGMMGIKGKANKQNQRSAYKQCASWFLSKNPFQALQAHNQLELPFLMLFEDKKVLIFPENFPRGGSIGDWGLFLRLDKDAAYAMMQFIQLIYIL